MSLALTIGLALLLLFVFAVTNFKTQNYILFKISSSVSVRVILKIFLIFFQISPLMFLFNHFLCKKSVGEELIYRGRDFNLLPFFCLAPLDSSSHWRSQSSGYEYIRMDVNLSAVGKLPLIIITILVQ